ncbi:hypothetical protein [Streptomyces sp. TX20-6-3]|uniref:hypothetical protein n=1 Tax=Streptomyces sp. TX20-6-3 TaxID=3028705 RepID=UPI0034DE9353
MNRNYSDLQMGHSASFLSHSQPGDTALAALPARTRALMQLAIRQAERSDCRQRVGAVLAVGNRVLSASPNLRRNSPSIDFRHATFHAEEAVLRKSRRAAGATAYVARVSSRGVPLMAQPCPRCHEALESAGVVRAYFTTNPSNLSGDQLVSASFALLSR